MLVDRVSPNVTGFVAEADLDGSRAQAELRPAGLLPDRLVRL